MDFLLGTLIGSSVEPWVWWTGALANSFYEDSLDARVMLVSSGVPADLPN